jgi:RimJ/RimL family protein N-acetyltransferase
MLRPAPLPETHPPRVARPMLLAETDLIIEYFHSASPEFLNSLGVDPSRLPGRAQWQGIFQRYFALPIEERNFFPIIWEIEGKPAGFTSADKIVFGQEAYMHLHIFDSEQRKAGNGTFFVKESAKIYFDTLRISRLYCEPYALNVAPNRTLQAAGFKYVKTHETVPGPLNFHQPVTRWILERNPI